MAEVAAPGSHASPPPHPPAHHGTAPHSKKRAADAPLENEQRLSKRFDLLNLVDNNGTRLYIPVPGSTDTPDARSPNDPIAAPHPLAATLPLDKSKSQRPPRPPRSSDAMDVEDTPHRVYIHDLAAELSDIESDEENPIFLSDIEKHLSKIPKHVLRGPEPKRTEHNQMVLYNVPASLSVPQERDNVRKAIVEARQRIRERQASGLGEVQRGHEEVRTGQCGEVVEGMLDSDAMDID